MRSLGILVRTHSASRIKLGSTTPDSRLEDASFPLNLKLGLDFLRGPFYY